MPPLHLLLTERAPLLHWRVVWGRDQTHPPLSMHAEVRVQQICGHLQGQRKTLPYIVYMYDSYLLHAWLPSRPPLVQIILWSFHNRRFMQCSAWTLLDIQDSSAWPQCCWYLLVRGLMSLHKQANAGHFHCGEWTYSQLGVGELTWASMPECYCCLQHCVSISKLRDPVDSHHQPEPARLDFRRFDIRRVATTCIIVQSKFAWYCWFRY